MPLARSIAQGGPLRPGPEIGSALLSMSHLAHKSLIVMAAAADPVALDAPGPPPPEAHPTSRSAAVSGSAARA
jgi:hypothetical protein